MALSNWNFQIIIFFAEIWRKSIGVLYKQNKSNETIQTYKSDIAA